MPSLRVAIAPDPVPEWARDAVERAGAEVVTPDAAEALVWLDPSGAGRLQRMLVAGSTIRWVQLPWAGVEEFAARGLFGDGRTWTSGKGVYAEPVAEHALMLGLAGLRRLHDRIRAKSWGEPAGLSLYDGRVTILGGGGIARSLAGLLAQFRADVTVVRRQPAPVPGASRVVDAGKLHDALAGADLVVLALALTPETVGIIGAEELRLLEPHTWLVNVARGRHVVTDDLVTALREDWIGGAALDVTDPEPLPDGHPLWDMSNCIITPHTADTPEMIVAMLSARIAENIRRFAAGGDLIGPVDAHAGY